MKKIILLLMLITLWNDSWGQVNMTATGTYSQNFNTLATNGSSNSFTNNSTIPSWYIQREDGNATPNIYAAGTGSSNGGRFYSFGSSGSSERALGQVNSGSTDDMAIGLLLRNTSGVTITSITVSYTLEQWRKGSDSSQGLAFAYDTSSLPITDLEPNTSSGWTSVAALNLNGPISSGSDNVALIGNSGSNRVSVANVSISGLSLANGDYIMLRWRDIDHAGEDHGLAIDDVTVNYTVPSVIFLNDITTNNNLANPYTTNQVVNPNATATGIGRGSGISYNSENGAYNANGWTTNGSLNSSDYYEFSMSPAIGYQLNFTSFDYQGQRRNSDAPEDFSFRSSLSSYGSSIGSNYTSTNTSAHNRSIDLSSGTYQNIQSAITFRLFGYDAGDSDGEFSINNFAFLGTVTMIPPTVSNTTPTAICNNGSGSVTISGNNLIHVTSVTVGGTSVSIDSKTNTQIVVTVPQGVSGLVTVTNDAGSANGATITLLNAVTYYEDADADGFGNPASSVSNCTGQPVGYVTNNLDCDDGLLLYEDLDEDGFGSITLVACGGVTNSLDTNDDLLTYVDADGDTYGSSTLAPSGASNNTDCDDSNPNKNPGEEEICWNNIDDNCDGNLSEGCAPVVVNMLTENNHQLNSFSTAVAAVPYTYIGGTVAYRFSFKNNHTGVVQEVISPTRFATIPSAIRNNNISYEVKVSAVINSENVPYAGNTITVLSPVVQMIKLAPSSCGVTLTGLSSNISSTVPLGAISYTFRIRLTSDSVNPTYYTVQSPSRFVSMNSFIGFVPQYATSYSVSVQYEYIDVISGLPVQSGYGEECIVTTPSLPVIGLSSPTCGTQVSYIGATISANPVQYAIQYEFRIRLTSDNGVSPNYYYTIPSASRFSSLSSFQGIVLSYDTQYSIAVRCKVYNEGNEAWSNFGNECIVRTPFFPVTEITPSQCGTSTTNLSQLFTIVSYPGFPTYRVTLFEQVGEDLVPVGLPITRTVSNFSLDMFTGVALDKNYSASVSIQINGEFGPEGKSCDISTYPPMIMRTVEKPFSSKVYPNPFAENFKMEITSSSKSNVTVKIYDMIGKLVEEKIISPDDLQMFSMGENYPSGVYNVVIVQDDNLNSMRVIKR